MEVGLDVFNVYLTDVGGDAISDLLYFTYDPELGNIVAFTIWDSETHTYLYIGETTFGDFLQNYYPFDIDQDGVSEIVTTNYVMDEGNIEIRVWKWDHQQLQFVVIEQLTIEHPTAIFASPIAGDFDGNGVVDIMVMIMENDEKADEFIMYTR